MRIPTGTTLITDNGLEFETTSSASVSAALSPTNPGSETVDVTSKDIGSEYNVSKDTTFTVGNFPKAEVDGLAANDFSGGSSEEVAAVSQEDMDTLQEELTEELRTKALEELEGQVADAEQLIEESTSSESADSNFSNSVGDEASSLKLDLALDVSALVVPRSELLAVAKATLEEEIPDGYVLKDEQLETNFNYTGEEDGKHLMETLIIANLLPEVNPDEIVEKIKGKYVHVANEYLNTIPGFVRVEISLDPKLPGRLGNIPYVEDNITVEIAAER